MKIVDFFNDPLHGFLALVGGVILSMFGAFIKDGLMYLLGSSSKYLKKKRDEDIKKRDLIVEQLVNSQPYLILYCTKTILSNISIALMFILIITLPSVLGMVDLNNTALELSKRDIITADTSNTVSLYFKIFVLLFSIVASLFALVLIYSVSKRNLIIAMATKMIQANLKSEDVTLCDEPTTATAQDIKAMSSKVEHTPPAISPVTKNSESKLKVTRSKEDGTIITTTLIKNGQVFKAKDGRLITIRKKE